MSKRSMIFVSAILVTATFRSVAEASSWATNGPLGGRIESLAINPANPNIVYAGTTAGGIFKSTNGGASWSPVTTGLTDTRSRIQGLVIAPTNTNVVYAGTEQGDVFVTLNAGATWIPVNNGLTGSNVFALAVDPMDSATVYAGTYTAGVFKTIDGGGTWTPMNNGLTAMTITGLAIDPTNPSIVYAAVNDRVFKTTNAGASWSQASSGLPHQFMYALAIDTTTPTTLYAGHSNRGVYVSTNGGTSWTEANTGLAPDAVWVFDLAVSVTGEAYAATEAGVYKTTNTGVSWTEVDTGLPTGSIYDGYAFAVAVDWFTPNTVYAGMQGGLFKTTNAGASWSASNTGLTGTFIQDVVIDPTSPITVYASASLGGLFKTTNGGTSWTEVNTGTTWDDTTSVVVDPATPTTVYASTSGLGIFKSLDGGGSWSSLPGIPAYVSTVAIDPSAPNTLYATASSDLYKTTDGGMTWTELSAGPPANVIIVDPNDGSTLYAGASNGMFKSTDGGLSWSATSSGLSFTYVSILAMDPADSSTLYTASSSFVPPSTAVFKTTNAGASWSTVGSLPPGVTDLEVDPTRSSTVYASTFSGPFKSVNGGASWSPMPTAGMTTTAVYSVAVSSTAIVYEASGTGVVKYLTQCGDGLLEGTEQCDNGPGNGSDGCCMVGCAKVPGTTCVGERSTGKTCPPSSDCTLTTPDGTISAFLPAGAIDNPTIVEIIGKNAGDRVYRLGTGTETLLVADLLPAGQTFNNAYPATLRFNWSDAPAPGDCNVDATNLWETDLQIYRDGAPLTKVCGTRDAQTNTCTAAAFAGSRCATGTLTTCKAAGCDFSANTYAVDVKRFSEYALARRCHEIAAGQMTVKKLDTPEADDRLLIKGTFTRPLGSLPLDPFTDGLVLALRDGDAAVLDVSLAGEAYDPVSKVGWKLNGKGTKWTYAAKGANPPGGITKVLIQDRGNWHYSILVKGKDASYEASPAVELSIVPAVAECYASKWPGLVPADAACELSASGSTLKCAPGTAVITTTTSTSTTSTLPEPDCASAVWPDCDGSCGGGNYCTRTGSVCVCGTKLCGNPGGPPHCWGECGAGGTCVEDSGGCICAPAISPCEDAAQPTCDGQCPSGQYCNDLGTGCGCVNWACGAVNGPPYCDGWCPSEAPFCKDVGGSCLCMP